MREPPHPLASTLAELLGRSASPRYALVLGVGSGRNLPPLLDAGLHIDVIEEDATRAATQAQRFGGNPRVRIAHGSYAAAVIREGPKRRYSAVLSTHALLHGTMQPVNDTIAALARITTPGAQLMLTLGSTRDSRCGSGRQIDERTWVCAAGSEAGIAHVYYDEPAVRALLHGFEIITLREVAARELVGSWAHHDPSPACAAQIIHWFVHAASAGGGR